MAKLSGRFGDIKTMREPQSITAICGWALPPQWFEEQIRQVFPGIPVHAVYPFHPDDPEEARNILQKVDSDWIIGYSLGSLWLAQHQSYIPAECQKILLAPILAFTEEQNKGGITNKTQLKYLARVLMQNSQDSSTLIEFFKDCRITIPEDHIKNVPCREALTRGLDYLSRESVSPESITGFLSIIGENDHLLDSFRLKQVIPNLRIIKDAGHGPGPLLQELHIQVISGKPSPNLIL